MKTAAAAETRLQRFTVVPPMDSAASWHAVQRSQAVNLFVVP